MKRKYGRTRRVTEVHARLVEILSLPDDVEFDGAELYRLLEEARGYDRTRKIAEDFLRKEPHPVRTERSKRWWRIYNAVIRARSTQHAGTCQPDTGCGLSISTTATRGCG